jgi:hypothetical protein
MQAPDPIETILARLMPPAMSQAAQQDMEAMIDDLAGSAVENVIPHPSGNWFVRSLIGGGIAAAIGAMAAVFPLAPGTPGSRMTLGPPAYPSSGLVLISGSDRVESMTDEGWQESVDGSVMHALRLKAVEESSVRDEETGIVLKISEPREEILLTPISSF